MQRHLLAVLLACIVAASPGRAYAEQFVGEMHIIGHQVGADGGEAEDIDGDGKLDVVAACEKHMVVLIIQPEDPTQVPWPHVPVHGAGKVDCAINCHLDDIDLDGDLDIVYADAHTSDLSGFYWFENPSPEPVTVAGNWTRHCIAKLPYAWFSGMLDITGNGKHDLICTTHQPFNQVFWLERPEDVTQEWTYHEITAVLKDPRWIAAGDISNNGDARDFVVATPSDTKLVWFEHTPAGWTRQHLITTQIPRCMGVQVGNLDDDPELEIIANTYDVAPTRSRVLVYDRDAAGNWEQSLINNEVSEGDCILRVDVDGDGQANEYITYHAVQSDAPYKNCVIWWRFKPASGQ